MAQFVSFDPNVKAHGTIIQTYITALGDAARALLEKHGLTHIESDAWYPLQPLLDVFREVSEGDFAGVLDLVQIGMGIPDHVLWPPEIRTLQDAFFSIDEAYHMNHKDGEIGHYHVSALDDRQLQVICENPYPCDFDYGLLYGIARRYLPSDGHLVVEHAPGPCRKEGAHRCTYYVRW